MRIMSLLNNIGLQSTGLIRKQMDDAASKCQNMAQLRKAAEKNPNIQHGTLDSIAPVKVLIMSSVFQRFQLKEKKIESFVAVNTAEIEEFCSSLQSVDE